jgi:hypothetical protein
MHIRPTSGCNIIYLSGIGADQNHFLFLPGNGIGMEAPDQLSL